MCRAVRSMALMLSAVILQELELGFNKLSDNNIELRKEKSKLEAQLKARAEERAALEKEMAKQQIDANKTEQDLKKKSVSSLPRWSPVQENIIVNQMSLCVLSSQEDCNRLLNLARRPLPPIQPHITRSSTSSMYLSAIVFFSGICRLIKHETQTVSADVTLKLNS